MIITEVEYSIAVSAPKFDILKYILTGGRYGRLFVSKMGKANKYWSELDPRTSINCRCSIVLPKKESE